VSRRLARAGGPSTPRSLRAALPRPVAVVALLVVTLLVASGCKFDGAYDLPLPGNKVDADDAYAVTAEFADALNVVPRTAVFANDVPVGQVSEVERVGWHARVTFVERKDIDLPENVEIDVRQTSLLGEKYLALVQPPSGTASAKRLSDGDVIPLSRTSRNPEVEEVLGALSMILSGGGVGQLKTISHELNEMMNGRQDQARHLLGNLDRMIAGLDEQKADIVAAMESIDRLSTTLVKEKDVIGEAIDSMGPALKVLNRQHRGLITMLRQLDDLGAVGTRVLNRSTDNIVASLRHLQPTLTRLGDVGDSLADGLSMLASFPFPQEAANIVKGDYANALFHMDINLNNIIKSPGEELPNLIGLCGALPLATACEALSPALKATVCAVAPDEVVALLCPPGSKAATKTPTPVPDLGTVLPKSSGASSGSSGSGGGLGSLLGQRVGPS
jgi:phospholipid/cholesterol/gamma-HCH transport system substrate-binding protein